MSSPVGSGSPGSPFVELDPYAPQTSTTATTSGGDTTTLDITVDSHAGDQNTVEGVNEDGFWTGELEDLPEIPEGKEWKFSLDEDNQLQAQLVDFNPDKQPPSIDEERIAAGLTPSLHLSNSTMV